MKKSTRLLFTHIIACLDEFQKAVGGWGTGGVSPAVRSLKRVASEELDPLRVKEDIETVGDLSHRSVPTCERSGPHHFRSQDKSLPASDLEQCIECGIAISVAEANAYRHGLVDGEMEHDRWYRAGKEDCPFETKKKTEG